MTRCLMERRHFKAWCERMKYTGHALATLARQKGATLRNATYLSDGTVVAYYVFPPGVTTVPYDRTYDSLQTRLLLEAMPDGATP